MSFTSFIACPTPHWESHAEAILRSTILRREVSLMPGVEKWWNSILVGRCGDSQHGIFKNKPLGGPRCWTYMKVASRGRARPEKREWKDMGHAPTLKA